MENTLVAILKDFGIQGNILNISLFGNGHINKTYLVETDENEYVLQEINSYVFKNPDILMSNISEVTNSIKNKGEKTLEVILTNNGELYKKVNDKYYRLYFFIKNSVCYETVGDDMSLTAKLGEAFGKFHHLLADLDPKLLEETIVDFHNTPKRFENFSNALAIASEEKKETATPEIQYVLDHKDTYSKVVDGIKNKEINLCITHNDPKINNILFDKATNDVLCVVDLDTVMPGSVLYDIGDTFRSLFTGENEDSTNLSLLKVRFDIFKAYMTSYLKEMKNDLTQKEIELIPYSIYLLTIECGMRFLEDYLRGNVYFRVKYEEHNLVRARTQIALAKDVLLRLDELNNIVKEILAK